MGGNGGGKSKHRVAYGGDGGPVVRVVDGQVVEEHVLHLHVAAGLEGCEGLVEDFTWGFETGEEHAAVDEVELLGPGPGIS